MADSDQKLKLYYWPKLCGRAEFVRIILEELAIPFDEINDIDQLTSMFRKLEFVDYPALAPPMLVKGDLYLTQTSVICEYLGENYGLYPESTNDKWHAKQLNATIHDFIGEGRLCFHGKDPMASYYGQQEETQPYVDRWKATRLPRFLKYFNDALKYNNGGKGFLFGGHLTYVDLGLLHVLRAAESQFPEEYNAVKDIDELLAYKSRLSARPNLAAYFASDRVKPFEGNSMM